jgi:hypothetical protein
MQPVFRASTQQCIELVAFQQPTQHLLAQIGEILNDEVTTTFIFLNIGNRIAYN